MTIYYQEIARQIVDLIDRLVENKDPKTEATRAVANLLSEVIESAECRPIWLWREFCNAILREMFPGEFFPPHDIPPPPEQKQELAVHENEIVIPFLVDCLMHGVLFSNDEQAYQELASKIGDEVFNDELIVFIRSKTINTFDSTIMGIPRRFLSEDGSFQELIHFKFKSRKDDPLDGKRKRPS